ncbi:ankyrin repeat domain-containing protein [Legionella lytica]|uniref:Ankyrin repeat domain-containing protein n=1 Tax=Legionella lytica TaxID=96232 RepID=A0ABY4Y7A2_9GAMM|nr:ankyrin repeat domain-containing protein [Legionella lytica]USQ13450.1 ankyrin repeat domain-containing protein [Legionella lytica]
MSDAKGNVQQNPVWLAAKFGYLDILQLLDLKGYSLDCVDADGDTVLHLAAMNGFSHVVFWLLNEKQCSFNALKNKAGYTPATCAVIMGRNYLLKELWNAGKLGISVTELAHLYNVGRHSHVRDFIELLEQFSKDQPYETHDKKLLEKKVSVSFELRCMLISFLHHYDAQMLSSDIIQQLCLLSENNVKRVSMLVDNLAKHKLFNMHSLIAALQRIQYKAVAPSEVSIATKRSHTPSKTQIILNDNHSFWFRSDNTLFARGGQGTIQQAYLSPNDVEPAYCVKQIHSGIVANLKEAARREAKCHRLFSRTSLYFSEGEAAFVVSSWQPGQALGRFSREQLSSLSFDTRLKCIITALSDLNQLHSRYRTYNDIKPLNFILDVPGQAMRLIDFGSVFKQGSTKKTMYTELYRDPVHRTGFLNDTYGMGLIIAVLFPDLFAANFVADSSQILVNLHSALLQHKAIIKLVQALINKDIEKRCTIVDALNYSERLMEKLSALDEASLDDIALSTIYRTNTLVEDVFRDARISRG